MLLRTPVPPCASALPNFSTAKHACMLTTTMMAELQAASLFDSITTSTLTGLVFHTLGFFDVGLNVFLGRLDYLAGYIVPCGPRQAQRTRKEWVELLSSRLKPVQQGKGPER